MKKIVFILLLLCSSCIAPAPQEPAKEIEKPHPITYIWIKYARKNPGAFNNVLSRSKAAVEVNKILMDSLTKNPQMLVGCPVQYEMLLQLPRDKYVIKLSLSRYNEQNISFNDFGTEYNVATDIFSVVSEEYAMQLKERQMYTLTSFTFEGDINKKHLILPSGRKLEREPSILSLDRQKDMILSGIYLSNIELKEL